MAQALAGSRPWCPRHLAGDQLRRLPASAAAAALCQPCLLAQQEQHASLSPLSQQHPPHACTPVHWMALAQVPQVCLPCFAQPASSLLRALLPHPAHI